MWPVREVDCRSWSGRTDRTYASHQPQDCLLRGLRAGDFSGKSPIALYQDSRREVYYFGQLRRNQDDGKPLAGQVGDLTPDFLTLSKILKRVLREPVRTRQEPAVA